jgi:hypothetical protein
VAADVGEEELEAVGRADDRLRVDLPLAGGGSLGLLGLGARLANLEPDRLELARELLDLFLTEIVLDCERLELDRLDVAALLTLLDEGARLLALQQFL